MLVSNESSKFSHLFNEKLKVTIEESAQFRNVSAIIWLVLIIFVFYYVLPKYFVFKKNWSLRGSAEIAWRLMVASFRGNAGLFKLVVEFLAKTEQATLWNTFGTKIMYVPKPEDIQIVLNKSQSMNKSIFYKYFTNILGEGLVNAPVDRWKIQKRIMTPAFTNTWIQNFFDIFNNRIALLIKELQSDCDTGEEIDMWNPLIRTGLEMSFDTTMGTTCGASQKQKEDYAHALAEIAELNVRRIGKLYLQPDFMYNICIKICGYSKYLNYIRDLPLEIIKRKKESPENGTSDPLKGKSFLDVLLKANEKEDVLRDTEILDEVITLLPAGSETSAVTGCYLLMMLGMNSEIQEKLYQEITEVLGYEREYVTANDLDRMNYLEQCFNETLRLFPTVPFLARRSSDSFQLSNGFVIPARSQIIISTFNMHRNAKIYENPLTWNPDNFTGEKIKSRHKYAYLPFSGGPKQCIGIRYANLTVKMTVAMIVRKYRVTTDVKFEDMEFYYDGFLKSLHGYKIRLHSREKTKNST